MIYGYELKKLVGMTKIPWVYPGLIVLSVAIQLTTVRMDNIRMDATETHYREYMEKLAGPVTSEKEKYMESERARIDEAKGKEEEMKSLYRAGEISEEEYFDYNDLLSYAKDREQSFSRVENSYAQISENGGWFVYDTWWCSFFNTDIYGFFLVLFLSAVFALYVGNEYASGMWQYLDSSSNGREKTIRAKCVIASALAMVLSVIYFFLRYILFSAVSDIPLAGAPLCSLGMFYHVGNTFSIGTFLVVTSLLQGIATAGIVLIVMFATYLSRNGIGGMAVGLGLYFLPFLVKEYSGEIFSFSLCGVINMAESFSLLMKNWEHAAVLCLAPLILVLGIILMYIYSKKGVARLH